MNRIIISQEVNPYYNLALEEALLYQVKDEDIILYLWQNERTVVIGRNQNPWLECNLDYLKAESIKLARRISGGGAVFHDLGNLNFTFITRKVNSDLEKQLSVLAKALKRLGVNVAYSGRNDLLTEGRKFSGHAFYEDEGYYFHHGTLMFDVDLNYLSQVLIPSNLKLESKGIKSVNSRVINLKQVNPLMTLEQLKESLITAFQSIYGEVKEVMTLSRDNYIPDKAGAYEEEIWVYGETPSFDLVIEEPIKAGILQVGLTIKNGKVEKVQVFSDTLEKVSFKTIEKMIKGKRMNEKEIRKIINHSLN